MKEETEYHILNFTESVLHGDKEHRDWLMQAAIDYIKENRDEDRDTKK